MARASIAENGVSAIGEGHTCGRARVHARSWWVPAGYSMHACCAGAGTCLGACEHSPCSLHVSGSAWRPGCWRSLWGSLHVQSPGESMDVGRGLSWLQAPSAPMAPGQHHLASAPVTEQGLTGRLPASRTSFTLLSLKTLRVGGGCGQGGRLSVCLSARPGPSPWGAGGLTGLCSGSQSGMLRPLISAAIFFRWPGLVTPMAVRS